MSSNPFHRLKKLASRPKPEKESGKSGPWDKAFYDNSSSTSKASYYDPSPTPKATFQVLPNSTPSRAIGELDGASYSGVASSISTSSAPSDTHFRRSNDGVSELSSENRLSQSVRDDAHRMSSPTATSQRFPTPSYPLPPNSGSHYVHGPLPIGWEDLDEASSYPAPVNDSNRIAKSPREDRALNPPVIAGSSKTPAITKYNPPSIVIIVMGLTGAGKSRFVREATGLDVDVGHSLVSSTADITPYEVSFGDRYGFLIDTPGFDDTYRTDVEIFRDVADWLARQYAHHELLTSIIYVHRITDSRVAGSALRNLTVMKKMLGVESFRNLVLVTSMWDLVEPDIGEKREKELSDQFWKDLLRAGARMERFGGDRISALRILTAMRSENPVTLTIQRELVDEGLQLDRTTAGTYLEREMMKTNAQQFSDVYLLAQQLNEQQANETHRRTVSQISQSATSTIGQNNESLKAHWNAKRSTLSQGGSVSSPSQDERDPEMYSPFQWEDDFRLVVLRAGSDESPIEISLSMATLVDPPEFVALSYVVGENVADSPINFRRDRWLSRLYISSNLREALQHLRLPDMDLHIWVDALSVNQADLEERAREVRMMSQIFRAAEGVCIWLGAISDGADVAMDFIPYILDFAVLEDLVKDSEHQKKWLLLAKLMSRPWFRRRWVVQEIMFAKDATVHCGDRLVSWTDFRDAATLFRTKWSDIQRHMGEQELAELGDAHLLGAIALIEISQSVFRRDAEGNVLEKLLNTETLLSLLPMFEVTDLLDTVYAILDMANDINSTNSVIVNYQQQPAELFRETIKLIVTSSGSLDIICRPWAPRSGLPSWITTVAKHTYRRRTNRQQYDRQNGTSLVGMPGNTFYRACGPMKATGENISFRVDGDQQVMSSTGRLIGTVTELGDKSINGNIPQEWMDLAGWKSLDEPSPPAFWRTIVANRAVDGSHAPDWYGRACEFAFRKSTTDDINTAALIRLIPSSHVREFLNRMLDVTWRRTFAIVKDGGATWCALCPPETTVGDFVCVLYGCSVPVVLRQQVMYYQLVGECFMYGIMDGEAISSSQGTLQVFDII